MIIKVRLFQKKKKIVNMFPLFRSSKWMQPALNKLSKADVLFYSFQPYPIIFCCIKKIKIRILKQRIPVCQTYIPKNTQDVSNSNGKYKDEFKFATREV